LHSTNVRKYRYPFTWINFDTTNAPIWSPTNGNLSHTDWFNNDALNLLQRVLCIMPLVGDQAAALTGGRVGLRADVNTHSGDVEKRRQQHLRRRNIAKTFT